MSIVPAYQQNCSLVAPGQTVLESTDYTPEEIARRGREIYERDIRSEVDPERIGDFVVVDITSGSHVISADEAGAFE